MVAIRIGRIWFGIDGGCDMARYIDVDALLENIQQKHCDKCNMYDGLKCKTCELDDTIYYLENAPTADVVPKNKNF